MSSNNTGHHTDRSLDTSAGLQPGSGGEQSFTKEELQPSGQSSEAGLQPGSGGEDSRTKEELAAPGRGPETSTTKEELAPGSGK